MATGKRDKSIKKSIKRIHYIYNIGDSVEFISEFPKKHIEKEYGMKSHFRVYFKNNKHTGIIEKVEEDHFEIRTITPLSGILCRIRKNEIIKVRRKSY